MDYRNMGRTGLEVSPLCLGTVLYGEHVGENASIDIILRTLDAGVNFFDTSNSYNNGASEEYLGKALAGRRHEAVIATKVGGRVGEGPNVSNLNRKHIADQIDRSLRRLRTDYVDIYYAHRFDPNTPLEETLDAFSALVRQGKVRYLGCSNFAAWQLCKALWISDVRDLAGFDCVQPMYNLLERDIERELVPLCEDQRVAIFPYAPLAGGLLSGRFSRTEEPEATSRLVTTSYYERYYQQQHLEHASAVRVAAERNGHTAVQLALAWTVQQPGITAAIVSARTWEQMEHCISALSIGMSDDEKRACDCSTSEEPT